MSYFVHRQYKFVVVAHQHNGVWYWHELKPGQRRVGSDPDKLFKHFFRPHRLPKLEFAHNVREVYTAGIPN